MATVAVKERWTEERVAGVLAGRFAAPAFAFIPQVRNGTGFTRKKVRTADALAMSLWPSRGLHLIGFEIKVSLADWKKELSDPEKSEAIQQFCDYWYVAAPAGIVPVAEVPPTWGLIECNGRGSKIAREAARLEPQPLDMPMLCAIMRRVHESTVPASEVNGRIRDAVEAAERSFADRIARDHKELSLRVAAFEAASGVKIDKWDGPDIGRAVKLVKESGIVGCRHQIKHILNSAQGIARLAFDSLEALGKDESDYTN